MSNREQLARKFADMAFGTDPTLTQSAEVHIRNSAVVIEGFDADGKQWVAVDGKRNQPIDRLFSAALDLMEAGEKARDEIEEYAARIIESAFDRARLTAANRGMREALIIVAELGEKGQR